MSAAHGDIQLTAVGRFICALYFIQSKRFSSTSIVSASKTEFFPVELNGRKETTIFSQQLYSLNDIVC